MKKLIIAIFLILFTGNLLATAADFDDSNSVKDADYYRRQIIIEEKYSKTNFFSAITTGNTKKVEAYIKSGMEPNTTMLKMPAIFLAIAAKHPSTVETLIQNGADVNISVMSTTPLLLAVEKKQLDCVKVLVTNKAELNAAPTTISPLYNALRTKQYDIAEYLVNAGAEIDDKILIKAIKSKNSNIKNLVIKKAAEQN